MEAIAFRMNMVAMTVSGIETNPAKCSAPCPDDITCGVTKASRPTMRPPSAGRSGGQSLVFDNSSSHSVTPRMMAMPVSADKIPSSEAMARSRPSTSPTGPTPTPNDRIVKA